MLVVLNKIKTICLVLFEWIFGIQDDVVEAMKFLMITRKVDKDDGLAGFTYNWIDKISKRTEKLFVICLEKGNIKGLGENVKIFSVRNNKKINNIIIRKIRDFIIFQKLVLQNIKKVDGIFCHMNPEYTIAVYPLAKIFNKKIISWYAHKQITFRLKLMEKITDKILTPSKKSFRLLSKKIVITGHGIDTEKFIPFEKDLKEKFTVISVGRISPSKDLETLIKAVDIIVNDFKEKNIVVKIIGAPGLKNHQSYYSSHLKMVDKMKLSEYIKFYGSIANKNIPRILTKSDLFINLSNTGSLDKAILEAMSCKLIVLTSNEAFVDIFDEQQMIKQNDFRMLAKKIIGVKNQDADKKKILKNRMRKIVKENHNLNNLIEKIIKQF